MLEKPVELYDIITGTIEKGKSFYDLSRKLEIPMSNIRNVAVGVTEHTQFRYILPCNKFKIFTLIDKLSKVKFDCIRAKTMEYYLNRKLSYNEIQRIGFVKQQSNLECKIDRYILFLENCDLNVFAKKQKSSRDWKKKNYNHVKKYNKDYSYHRRNTDIYFRILNNLRTRLRQSVKTNSKKDSTLNLVGCSISFLRKHLENQFKEGMTWDNYGRNGWHIDHMIPCAAFNLTKEEEQRKCFHWSNLQPLWEFDNLSKGSKIEL